MAFDCELWRLKRSMDTAISMRILQTRSSGLSVYPNDKNRNIEAHFCEGKCETVTAKTQNPELCLTLI